MAENIWRMTALAEELERFILQSIPGSETVKKYGGTLFTLKPQEKEGQFCGVFIYKAHVQISFSKGAQLKDSENLLLGNGKIRRHINLTDPEEIDYPAIEELLKQASKI